MLNVLIIMDPISKLNIEIDTTLHLLRELAKRGHHTWIADTSDIWMEKNNALAKATFVLPKKVPGNLQERLKLSKKKAYAPFKCSSPKIKSLQSFDTLLVRKEPPFDFNYFYLTLMLEHTAKYTSIVNTPAAIRRNNEKLSILNFEKWIPNTLVSSSLKQFESFKREQRGPIVLKPLDNKGGRGVTLVKTSADLAKAFKTICGKHSRFAIAQSFLKTASDKRITLLDGKFFYAYEKIPAANDFRGNFSQGAQYQATSLSAAEKKLVAEVGEYMQLENLQMVGLDVMKEKLIDFNVTCPGGLVEATELYPQQQLVERWADSLETRASLKRR